MLKLYATENLHVINFMTPNCSQTRFAFHCQEIMSKLRS